MHFDRLSVPTLLHDHGKIVPVNASAFNKSHLIATTIIIAASERMRREACLRGGSRAEGSSDQPSNAR